MGKKNGRNRGKSVVEGEFDDTSVASSGSLGSTAPDTAEPFDLLIDALYEKSSAKKIKGLTGLLELLSSYVLYENCVQRGSLLASQFSCLIRRGRSKESLLASRGLCLLLLTLGKGESVTDVWNVVKTELVSTSLTGKSPELKSTVIEAYALGCFVAEEDPFEIKSVMESLQVLWKNSNSKVVSSAVKGWALNLSSLSEHMMQKLNLDQAADELCSMLEVDNPEIQEAAGMALVLLFHLNPELEEDLDSDVESSCGSLSTTMSQMSKLDEAKDKMKDLSTLRSEGQKKSKKQRAHTKAAFRDIYNFMEDGELKVEKIKLQHGEVLVLSSLRMQIQMKFIRGLLNQGFHRHLHDNDFLHEVFDFKPHHSPVAKMTASQKRFHKSPSSWLSKTRTRERDWDRAQKQVYLQGGVGY